VQLPSLKKKHTAVVVIFLFSWSLIQPVLVKNRHINSGLENGRHKTTGPIFFACITNYLYICVVLDLPLLIMECMNWNMASGLCLHQLMIDHVSIRFVWMFCSTACRPTWLVINSSPTN
jgi:hypothetical protein